MSNCLYEFLTNINLCFNILAHQPLTKTQCIQTSPSPMRRIINLRLGLERALQELTKEKVRVCNMI